MLLHRFDDNTMFPALPPESPEGTPGRPPGRRLLWLTLLVVGLSLPVIWQINHSSEAVDIVMPVESQATLPADDAVPDDYETVFATCSDTVDENRMVKTTLGNGGTLSSAFQRVGLPESLVHVVARAAGQQIDLRRLSPRTGISAVLDQQGIPCQLAIRTEASRFLRLALPAEATPAQPIEIETEWISLPITTTIEMAGGIVRSSVAQALSGTSHGHHLTNSFSDLFQWDIDLLIDPRPGDQVRIVYEIDQFGRLPADLPAFGATASKTGEFLRIGRILAASYDGMRARSRGFWVEDEAGVGSYYDDRGQPLRKAFLKSPLNYRRISSGFSHSRRHPVTRKVVPHHGIDFAADPGTPVVATADGKITSAGWDGPLGKAVRIKHGSTYETIYGHLQGFAKGIRRGVEIRQNQVIGYVGSTGRATGPHLHYTLREKGRAINPATFKNPPAEPLAPELETQLASLKAHWLPVLQSIVAGDSTYEVASSSRSDGLPHGL